MKTPIRLAASATAAITTFFVAVLGIEYAAWFHAGPIDPLADPALNAVRFAVAGAAGLAAGLLAYPRIGRVRP